MFKELFALTERAPVLVLLAREGEDKLRVNITRKRDEDDKEVPLSLSILATPAELDAELPLALAEGFALTEDSNKVVSVADQVKGQVDAAKTEDAKPITPKVKKMRTAKAARAAPAPKKRPGGPEGNRKNWKTAKQHAADEKAAKKTPAKKAARKEPKLSRSDAAQRSALTPTLALAGVIGPEPLRYNEAMSKVWGYIKTNNLQDPKNKRKITADEKLQAIAGNAKLSVENLGKHVKANLLAPLRDPLGTRPEKAPPKITPLIKPENLLPPSPQPEAAPVAAAALDEVAQETDEPADAPAPAKPSAGGADLDLF